MQKEFYNLMSENIDDSSVDSERPKGDLNSKNKNIFLKYKFR